MRDPHSGQYLPGHTGRPKGSYDKGPRRPRGAPPVSKSKWPKPITHEQRVFADKVLEGVNATQAAVEAFGITKPEERKRASKVAARTLRKEAVIQYFNEQSKGAATRIVEISKKEENDMVKLNANKEILDRAGMGVKQFGAIAAVQINFDADREEFGR